jgi:DNA-binding transcriptional regulator YhcF (GntR family)
VAPQPGRSPAKYRQIAADLLARIGAGEYPVGSTLPTKPELIDRYGAALGTIDHALAELRKAGVAESRQGVGTFVVRQHPEPPEQDAVALQVTALRDEVCRLTGQLESLKTDGVRAGLERIELNLIDLYGKLGYDYPREDDAPEAIGTSGRAVAR